MGVASRIRLLDEPVHREAGAIRQSTMVSVGTDTEITVRFVMCAVTGSRVHWATSFSRLEMPMKASVPVVPLSLEMQKSVAESVRRPMLEF